MKILTKTVIFALVSLMLLASPSCTEKGGNVSNSDMVSLSDSAFDAKDYAGAFAAERFVISIDFADETSALIAVELSSSPKKHTRWEMTGRLDRETLRLVYSDCTAYEVKYDKKGNETKKLLYSDGMGKIIFSGKDELKWVDEQNPDYADLKFIRS